MDYAGTGTDLPAHGASLLGQFARADWSFDYGYLSAPEAGMQEAGHAFELSTSLNAQAVDAFASVIESTPARAWVQPIDFGVDQFDLRSTDTLDWHGA
jgi:hypothetical protein